MKRHIRIIRFLTVLIISSIFITGCSSSGNKTGVTGIPSFNIEKLKPAKSSFCFIGDGSGGQPHNVAAINEMLAELNKKTLKEINTEVSFQWIPYENYDSKLTELLKSGSSQARKITTCSCMASRINSISSKAIHWIFLV